MIFISHASKDKDLARQLAEQLGAAGYDVWSESKGILPGDNWASAIGQALEKADLFVVLVTSHSAESDWVSNEVQFALTRNDRAPLVPVFVGAAPSQEVPWVLRKMKGVHVDGPQEFDQVVRAVDALKN